MDAESGLVHCVKGMPGNVGDVMQANSLLHGAQNDVFADADDQGAGKRPDARAGVSWHIAMRSGKRRALDNTHPVDSLVHELQRLKASVRAKVEHPFRLINRKFAHVSQGALQRTQEEHYAVAHFVRAVQPVDAARQTASTGWALRLKAPSAA